MHLVEVVAVPVQYPLYLIRPDRVELDSVGLLRAVNRN
jgi:hypothetical protein